MTPDGGDPVRDLGRGALHGLVRSRRQPAAGRYGDLIAVRGDPLADPRLLQHVALVVKGGEVITEPGH